MTALPIAFRTNQSKYSFAGEAQLINGYAEQQGNDAKAPLAILPDYGMTEFAAVTDTPCRGSIYLDDLDCIYSVFASGAYKVLSDGTSSRIGLVPGSDIVELSRNQATIPQISITCAAGEYYIENDVVKKVTTTNLPTPIVSHDHLGGYTVRGLADRRFFLSAINATQTVDALDYATAEQSADPLVRVKADGDLFIFKKKQTEQWRNTGNASFPFEPIGTPIRHGLLASEAVTPFDNTLAFIGEDAVVYRIAGTGSVQRISTHGIERSIANDPSQSDIVGFSYSNEGHLFAGFTGSDFTRVYDAATQTWHTRQSWQLDRWRARFPVFAWGKWIVGDTLTGSLYFLDKDSYTEGSDPIVWGVDLPPFHVFPNGGVIDAVAIDVATGVGNVTGDGSDPKLMLDWSVDGGATWKGHRELSLGASGDRVRVTTRRLGRFGPQGVTFRLRISDPVIRSLLAMDVKVRGLQK